MEFEMTQHLPPPISPLPLAISYLQFKKILEVYLSLCGSHPIEAAAQGPLCGPTESIRAVPGFLRPKNRTVKAHAGQSPCEGPRKAETSKLIASCIIAAYRKHISLLHL